MLLSLFHWLSGYVRAFAVFDYLSLRAVLAALTDRRSVRTARSPT